MAMFGAGGGGNFDPSNWVDHNVYNEVMNGENGSYHHNKKNDNHKHIKKHTKILLWISLGGFVFWFFVARLVFAVTKDNDYLIRAIFDILPHIWLLGSLVIGLVIILRRERKQKENDPSDKKRKIAYFKCTVDIQIQKTDLI